MAKRWNLEELKMPEEKIMELKNKEILHRDYNQVSEVIRKVLEGDEQNYFVSNPDFLEPTCTLSEVEPLYSGSGILQHFMRIRNALEIALTTGSIPKDKMPPRAPDYLQELGE